MTRVYYRRASACIIMFAVDQPSSFYNAAKWKKDLDSKCFDDSGKKIPCILVANKVGLLKLQIFAVCQHFLNYLKIRQLQMIFFIRLIYQ